MNRPTILQRRARRALLLIIAPVLPGALLLGVAALSGQRQHQPAWLDWCAENGPWILATGLALYAVVAIGMRFRFHCAACGYRLTRSLSIVSLASHADGVRHCPQCGAALQAPDLPDRARRRDMAR